MGSHADAVLAYGYNLGGGEKWEVAEADSEYGDLTLGWFTDEDGDGKGDGEGFAEAATARLLTSIDFAVFSRFFGLHLSKVMWPQPGAR